MGQKRTLFTALFGDCFPPRGQFGGVSVPVGSTVGSTGLADGGSSHADTINSYPTRTACLADLRDHVVRLMQRRGRHGLRGCGDECIR
jgi:hypothetical protein